MADFFGSGSNQPMPSFNLITTRPISKSRWIRSLIFGPTKKTSPHSVPPSAGNSLYRIPFCLKPQQKKNTKSTSNCSSKLHLTFGQIKTIGHIEKDSLWIDGFGELECSLAPHQAPRSKHQRFTRKVDAFLPTSAGLMFLIGFFERMDDLMLPCCNCSKRYQVQNLSCRDSSIYKMDCNNSG